MAVSRFRPVDWLVSGYAAIVVVTAASRLPGNPSLVWVMLGHALIPALAWALSTTPVSRSEGGRVLRELYPLFLLIGLYSALDPLARAAGMAVHDATVQRWELALFGMQPSRLLWQAFPSPLLSSVLHAAYLAYYGIVAVPPVVLACQRKWQHVQWYVFNVLLTFVVCYVVFLFFPVAGPYYEFERPAAWFLDNGPARAVYAVLAGGSSYGAAFPSSHVAATLVSTAAAWRASRPMGAVLAAPAALLTMAVVYCQMHYAVDALAGIAVAAGCLWIGARVMRSSASGDAGVPAGSRSL
ncbi:MAG TPA: phosphatase PAP2 family protein [Gemmatimonadaceae bacterium]|nr:phosphatase PAP2 family protein [Gemmatimonadaceae bacterium]